MPLVALANPGVSDDLDRYELLFRFAAGGMAEVFVARQRGEGGFLRPVAIKRMLPALAEEPKFVEMFLDEARLAAHVQSPYVVSTLDCGKDEEGSPYIVMELVVGVSLSQALRACVEKKRHVPHGVMVEVIAETALGLYDAHHARTPTGQPLEIVHRDVSPQNVLVGVDGRARLTDFGVARALERVTRTNTGEVKGKLSYFSPEQARMEPIDQRSDIFALGIVAWETLALERLFSRESPMAAISAILHERIPDVREHNPDVPERLALVVARALERDLSKRYPNARMFAEELRAAVGTPATAQEVGRWVEECGGPRLDTFRKRIETSFRAGTAAERASEGAGQERERSSASAASQRASFSSKPESRVVGELGTIPDQPAEPEAGTHTDVRPTRVVSVPPAPTVEVPIELSSVQPAGEIAARSEGAPRSKLPLALAALVGVAGAAGLGVWLSTTPPPTTQAAPPAPTVIAPPAPDPVPTAPPPTETPAEVIAPLPTGTETPAPVAARGRTRPTGGAQHVETQPTEAARAETARTEQETRAVTTVETRSETARSETARTETPTRSETARTEPAHTEPAHTEPAHTEPAHAATQHEETSPEQPEAPGGRLRVGTGVGRLRGAQ